MHIVATEAIAAHAVPAADAVQTVGTDLGSGLTPEAARRRLDEGGRNELSPLAHGS